jgi:hypothetical protein
MIRNFRVSVSDRYPVKADKWKDLGTYEAKNSRELQAFLIENPQIWARYIRIEFLSHYGNEYYCPLSLVRVHGTRMLESWKETEAISEGEGSDDAEDQSPEEQFVPEAVAEVVQMEERLKAEERKDVQETMLQTTPLRPRLRNVDVPWFFNVSTASIICLIAEAPIKEPAILPTIDPDVSGHTTVESILTPSTAPTALSSGISALPSASPLLGSAEPEVIENSLPDPSPVSISSVSTTTKVASGLQESTISSASPIISKSPGSVATSKSKTTTTSSATSALPTIQESFFKAVSRRLQLLESSSTLSLQYIEEQSKILREAFSKVDKKQQQRTGTFLETLNSTVFTELRGIRQQYDEIWQSTVISLESQREESRREILAISARLNILADEVIFQKRMSIVQSVLLLLCLGLVIFSRASAAGHLDIHNIQTKARAFGFPLSPLGSPPASPEFHRTNSMRQEREWLEPEDLRRRSDGSVMSQSIEHSPPTPISAYSRSEPDLTPSSGPDDLTSNIDGNTSDCLSPPHTRQCAVRTRLGTWDTEGNETSSLSSPTRTPRKRKAFIRQQASPSQSGTDEKELTDDDTETNSPHLGRERTSSFPSHHGNGFSIARKPLPALPSDGE